MNPPDYDNLDAGDTAEPRVKDILRIPGWEPTYTEIPIHWIQNRQWNNANYVAVTGHIVRKDNTGKIWERPIPVFVDTMIYNPRYAHLDTYKSLYRSSESVQIKTLSVQGAVVAGSEYLEFKDLHYRGYDVQYAKVKIQLPSNAPAKQSWFLVIQPLNRTINAVSRFCFWVFGSR